MKILVIDPQADLRDLIGMMLEMHFNCIVLHSSEVADGIQRISTCPDLDGVICAWRFADGSGAQVLARLRDLRPGVPFALCSSEQPAELSELKGLLPDAHIPRPGVMEALKTFVREKVRRKDPEADDSGYCRVNLKTLLKFGMSTADLYMKLGNSKYVRVFKVGDTFDLTDFGKYDAKKIDYLYIREEDSPRFLERVSKNVGDLSESRFVEYDRAIEISSETLEVIAEFDHRFNFGQSTRELALSSVEIVLKGLQSSPKLSQFLDGLKVDSDRYLPSHSVVVAFLSCGIAALMGWTAEGTYQALAAAALLHDLALSDEELARIRNWEELNRLRKELGAAKLHSVLYHPEEAAQLASQIPGVPADTQQIIRQHHERPGGQGFPLKLSHEDIFPLSAVFIVAHDLVNFHFEGSKRFDFADFMRRHGDEYRIGIFHKLAQAITCACV